MNREGQDWWRAGWFETLAPHLRLFVTDPHRFGGDAFYLSDFAAPRPQDRVCDLCSGCGIVPALWFREPQKAPRQVWAVELQPLAVRQMRRSVEEGGLPQDRFCPVEGDLRQLEGVVPAAEWDLVTCNPPYYQAGHGLPSQSVAGQLVRHEAECTLEEVCLAAKRLLRFGGRFCLCHKPQRLVELLETMRACQLEPKRLRMVQQRVDTAPWLVLVEGRRGGKPGLQVEAPLILEEAGALSEEGLRIYRKEQRL